MSAGFGLRGDFLYETASLKLSRAIVVGETLHNKDLGRYSHRHL